MLKTFGVVMLGLGLFSCGSRPTEQRVEVTLASRLISNNQLGSFSFCEAGLADWDSILVLKPYCPSEAIKLFVTNNYWTTRLLAPNQESNDFSCTLIFLRQKSCVGYSTVRREIVDMTGLANEKDTNLTLITRANCVKKLHRNNVSGCIAMVD